MNYLNLGKGLAAVLLLIAAFFFGKSVERNSQENKIKADAILRLHAELLVKDKVIAQERLSRANSDALTMQFKTQIESRDIAIEKLKKDIQNDKKRIDSTNRTNGLLVRYIEKGTVANSVPAVSTPTSSAYGESQLYSSTEFATYIVDQFNNCNNTVDQLKALQQWIRDQEKIYNH